MSLLRTSLMNGVGGVAVNSGGIGITPASATVPEFSPSGYVVTKLSTTISGAVLSVVSGPATKDGSDNLILSAAAGAADTVQTVRVKAERASPFLSVIQDIPIRATQANAPAFPTYYIKPGSGSDSNTGTNEAVAWRTMANVTAALPPNSTVWVFTDGTDLTEGFVAPAITGLRIVGTGGKPKMNGFTSAKATAPAWTEVANDATTATPGSWKWITDFTHDGSGKYMIALNGVFKRWRSDTLAEMGVVGEWALLPGNKLVIYSPTNPASTYSTIQISSTADSFDAKACPGIWVENIEIKGYRNGPDWGAGSKVVNTYVHLTAGWGHHFSKGGVHTGNDNVVYDCGWEGLYNTNDTNGFGIYVKGETGLENTDITWYDTKVHNTRCDCTKTLDPGTVLKLWSTAPGLSSFVQRGSFDENVGDNQGGVVWYMGAKLSQNLDPDYTAYITASASGTTATVTAVGVTPIRAGMELTADTLNGVRTILAFGTAGTTGTGGTGTYALSASTTYASGPMIGSMINSNSCCHLFGIATILENCIVNDRHVSDDGYALFSRKSGGGFIGWDSAFFGRGTTGAVRFQDGGTHTFLSCVFKSVGGRTAYPMEAGKHILRRCSFFGATGAQTSAVQRSNIITTTTVMYRAAASNGDGTTYIYGTCTNSTNFMRSDSWISLAGITNYTGLNGDWYVDTVTQTLTNGLFRFKVSDAVAATLPANPTTFNLAGTVVLTSHPILEVAEGNLFAGTGNGLNITAKHIARGTVRSLQGNAFHDYAGSDTGLRIVGDVNNLADATTRNFDKTQIVSNNGSSDAAFYSGGLVGGPLNSANDVDETPYLSVAVSSLTITNGVATLVTAAPHPWATGVGKKRWIEGVTPDDLNGFHFMTIVNSTTITFLSEWYLADQTATGTITISDLTPSASSPAKAVSTGGLFVNLPVASAVTTPTAATPANTDLHGVTLTNTGWAGAVSTAVA